MFNYENCRSKHTYACAKKRNNNKKKRSRFSNNRFNKITATTLNKLAYELVSCFQSDDKFSE